MSEKGKPPEGRKPEDYREAAEDSLELAKVLAGQGEIGDQDFLERMARSDAVVDHDGETCGMCHNILLGARDRPRNDRGRRVRGRGEQVGGGGARRWEQSKFFKLWQEEQKAGRDPHKAFEERGWEP